MKLKRKKINPKITLYYLNVEPDCALVKKTIQIFDGSVKPFKTKHRHQVYLLEHNSEVFYVKKFSPPTIEQNLSYRFRQSKAVSCLNIANRLQTSGFKIIEPVFVLNYYKNLKHESILVTKKTEGTNLKTYLINEVDNIRKKEVMNCLVSTLGAFYKNGFLHYDPMLTNFLIEPEKKPYEITFLDFESISFRYWVSTKNTFNFISKFCYHCFAFLARENCENLYSREKMLLYLTVFLKSYNPTITIDKAYKYLSQGIISLLGRKGKLSAKNEAFLKKLIKIAT